MLRGTRLISIHFPLLMTAITFIGYFSPADIDIEVSFQRSMSAKSHRMSASHYILLAVGRFGIPRKIAPTCSQMQGDRDLMIVSYGNGRTFGCVI